MVEASQPASASVGGLCKERRKQEVERHTVSLPLPRQPASYLHSWDTIYSPPRQRCVRNLQTANMLE